VAGQGGDRGVKVVIADDQALVRGGFRLILTSAGIEVAAEAADGAEAVAATAKHRPDVVLMDIRMPVMDGIEATKRILSAVPAGADTRIIILTTFDLDEYVYSALAVGASGFLLKDVTPEHLVAAVRLVRTGDALLAPSITRRLVARFAPRLRVQEGSGPPGGGLSALTPRETEVLGLVARGLSNAEIAASLTLSEATVKTHVARILAKLDLRDRVQAVVLAYETGLVSPGQGLGDDPGSRGDTCWAVAACRRASSRYVSGLVSTHCFAPGLSSPTTRAGTPAASMPSGTRIPGGTMAPAATRARLPISAPSSTVAPLPISASFPIRTVCTTQR
jgi:DNA-binding NarL/FixJ family response regulator